MFNEMFLDVIPGCHYGFSKAVFKERLLRFLYQDQRLITQCSVSHFALVGCKLIVS